MSRRMGALLDLPDDPSARAHLMNVTGQSVSNDRIVADAALAEQWCHANGCRFAGADGSFLYASARHEKVVRFPTMGGSA